MIEWICRYSIPNSLIDTQSIIILSVAELNLHTHMLGTAAAVAFAAETKRD